MGWFDVAKDVGEYMIPEPLEMAWGVANTGYQATAGAWDYLTGDSDNGAKHMKEAGKGAAGLLVPILGDGMHAADTAKDIAELMGYYENPEDKAEAEQENGTEFDWGGAGLGGLVGSMFGPVGLLGGALGGGLLGGGIIGEGLDSVDDWSGLGAGLGGGLCTALGPLGWMAGAAAGGTAGALLTPKAKSNHAALDGMDAAAAAMKAMGHYAD